MAVRLRKETVRSWKIEDRRCAPLTCNFNPDVLHCLAQVVLRHTLVVANILPAHAEELQEHLTC